MENNLITEYQVIDGSAIVDRDLILLRQTNRFFALSESAVNVYIHSRYYTSG